MSKSLLSSPVSLPGDSATPTQRVALVVQYLGTAFHGWQWQPGQRTVQGELEAAVAQVTRCPVRVHGAGRTDAGVHAAAQVAHFDAPGFIPAHRWADILNGRLPEDVLVRAAVPVGDDWHAQFSACWRRYRYTIYTDKYPNLFLRQCVWHYYHHPLNLGAIRRALVPLVGHHDLTAFHRTRSGRAHSMVDLQVADCQGEGPFVTVELQAKGFLYGMVRLVVGLLVDVGRGVVAPEEFTHIWQQRQRERVKYSAPARGLCLRQVGYDPSPFDCESWVDAQPRYSFDRVPKLQFG